MKLTTSLNLFAASLLVCSVPHLVAQAVPTDNDQWKAHCAALVEGGALPPPDGSGIPAQRFEDLARERSAQGQHFVACSLFMAAGGGEAASGNAQRSRDDMLLAKIEQKMGSSQKLSFIDKLTRSSDIIANMKTTSPATQSEAYAMAMLVQGGGAPGGYPPPQYAPAEYSAGAPQYPQGMPYGAQGGYPAPGGQYPAQPGQYPPPQPAYPAQQQAYSQQPSQYGAPAGQYPPQPSPDPYATQQPQYAASAGQYSGAVPSQPGPSAYPPSQNQYAAASAPSQGQYSSPARAGYPASPQYGAPVQSSAASYSANAGFPPAPAQSTSTPQPRGTQSAYTPLPNGQVADTGTGRMQWVLQHPSAYRTPQACTVDWTGSGPLSQACADALFNQAEAARNAGNCNSALTDYDNAKQAAQNSGQIIAMNAREVGGRSACGPKPKPEAGAHYGRPGVMPVGRYTCSSAPAVIANGGAYGETAVTLGQFGGYMWIFDATRYAGADIHNTGTYVMRGNTIVAETGPYKGKGSKLTWAAKGAYGRPTIYLAYLDDNGNSIGGLGCTYDGPPTQ